LSTVKGFLVRLAFVSVREIPRITRRKVGNGIPSGPRTGFLNPDATVPLTIADSDDLIAPGLMPRRASATAKKIKSRSVGADVIPSALIPFTAAHRLKFRICLL
jgi:hypothetical protein